MNNIEYNLDIIVSEVMGSNYLLLSMLVISLFLIFNIFYSTLLCFEFFISEKLNEDRICPKHGPLFLNHKITK